MFFIIQLVTKQIIKQNTPGSVVLIASQSSHIGLPGYRMAAYNASKGGVLMLSKALAVELAKHNIDIKLIPSNEMTADALTKASNYESLKALQQKCFSALFSSNCGGC